MLHKGIVGIVSVVLLVSLMGSVGPKIITYIVDDTENISSRKNSTHLSEYNEDRKNG
mgnify:CR=1 FL=1